MRKNRRRPMTGNGMLIDPFYPVIHSVSGPLSMHVLTKARDEKNNASYPTVLLFGERHNDLSTVCRPCRCVSGIMTRGRVRRESCCVNLYDVETFLIPLDSLAKKHGPVHVYTETFPGGITEPLPGHVRSEMSLMYAEELQYCYHRKWDRVLGEKCPTKHVQWHGGDTRKSAHISSHPREAVLFDDTLSSLTSFSKTIRSMGEKEKFHRNALHCLYLEGALTTAYTVKIGEWIDNRGTYERVEGVYEFVMEVFGESDWDKKHFGHCDVATLKHIWKTVLRHMFQNDEEFGTKAAVHFLCEELKNSGKSLLCRQLKKQRWDKLKRMRFWEPIICQYIDTALTEGGRKPFDIQRTLESGDVYDTMMTTVVLFMHLLTSALANTYTVARILKQPNGAEPCKLAVCYFGQAHTNHIKSILMSTLGYECLTVGDYEVDPPTNYGECIRIDRPIDLPSLISSSIQSPGHSRE